MWKLNFPAIYKCSCYSFYARYPHEINIAFEPWYWVQALSSTSVDICWRVYFPGACSIKKMLTARASYPQKSVFHTRTGAGHKNKFSYTAGGRVFFPRFSMFCPGFYTTCVDKTGRQTENPFFLYVLVRDRLFSHFDVNGSRAFYKLWINSRVKTGG